MPKEIPDLYYEQLHLNELSDAGKKDLMNNPETMQKLKVLEESDREIHGTYDFGEFARRAEEALAEEAVNDKTGTKQQSNETGRFSRLLFSKGVPVLAAAALMAAVILPFALNSGSTAVPGTTSLEEEGIRLKGLTPELKVYRKSGDSVELLEDRDAVHEQDLLQISYQAAGKQYGTIFSIDGNGFVTLHYPDSPSDSLELVNGGEVPLDFSYRLDDAPGYERFFFITSDSYFSITQILDDASQMAVSFYEARNGELPVPEVCELDTILLLKEDSHER